MWRSFDTDPAVYRRPPETLRHGSRGLSGGDRRGQKTHTRQGQEKATRQLAYAVTARTLTGRSHASLRAVSRGYGR